MTPEQISKMKKKEYNKKYYIKKKQEEFVKAIKLIQANWYTIISNWERAYLDRREKKLHKIIVILSIIAVILFILILVK